MRIGSLCSGAGGLDLAVEAVFGARTIWHCENDPAASKVLAHRWPGIPNHSDIAAVDWDSLAPVEIMTGGYPCQPFSLGGKRKGTNDERHIWPHVREAIRRVRPRYTILENVAGHRSLGFDRVLGDLAEDGMHARWASVRASDVGAPHQRERLFILATPADAAGECRADIEGCGDPAGQPVVTEPGAGGRDRRGPATEGVRELRGSTGELAAIDLLPTPAASRSGRNRSASAGAAIRPSLDSITNLLPTPQASDGNGGKTSAELGPAASDAHRGPDLARVNRVGSGGDDLHTFVHKTGRDQQWGKYAAAISRWEWLTRPAPSPTESNSKGNPRLSAPFPEWMQGWPAGWVTAVPGISRNDMLRIIGNGVCPQQAIAALYQLSEFVS